MPPPSELSCTEGQFLALDAATLPPNTVTRISCPPKNTRGYGGYLKKKEVQKLLGTLPAWELCTECPRVSPASTRKLCPLCTHRVLVKHHARTAAPPPTMNPHTAAAAARVEESLDSRAARAITEDHAHSVAARKPPGFLTWCAQALVSRFAGTPMPQPPAPAQLPSGHGIPLAAVPSAQGNVAPGLPLAAVNHGVAGAPAR